MIARLLLFLLLLVPTQAVAQRPIAGPTTGNPAIEEQVRLALLIGNSRYEAAVPLRNPENDVEAVAGSLEAVGFRTTVATNLDHAALRAAVSAFVDEARGETKPFVFVYFAGHGVQRGGRNFLLPTDADVDDPDALETAAIDTDALVEQLAAIDPELLVVVLDACRNDPFENLTRGAVSIAPGLAAARETPGRLIAYSTAPGRTALDGTTGTSPYAAAFAEAVLVPGLTVRGVFDRVREKVLERTGGAQEPWETSALYRDAHFVPPAAAVEISEVEALTWDNVSLLDSAEAYQRYVTRFPNGRFAALARKKIDNINRDFTFRKQSETFPVLTETGDTLDFCRGGQRSLYAYQHLYALRQYKDALLYVDFHVPMPNVACLGDMLHYPEEIREQAEPCEKPFFERAHDPRRNPCMKWYVMMDEGWADLIDARGFVAISAQESLIFSAASSTFYDYFNDGAEGQPEHAYMTFKGLVRVRVFEPEVGVASFFMEPVDPAALGLSWKFQNTLEAMRAGGEAAGLDLLTLTGISGLPAVPEPLEPSAVMPGPPTPGMTTSPSLTSPGARITSFWNHNGSIMGLVEDGDLRQFVYMEPREALAASGISRLTMLFGGITLGSGTYAGESFTFLKACGSTPYQVRGSTSPDGFEITLAGDAPNFDEQCREIGRRAVEMKFELLSPADIPFASIQ